MEIDDNGSGNGTVITKTFSSKIDYTDGEPHEECYQSQSINQIKNGHKISEKQDEDEKPFELDLPEKDFFNDENESNKEEKSTTFKKHKNSRSKRIVEKINQYKEYSTTMDHRDTDSQLKSSKREAATKKFFNSNPPKKTNDTLSNKYNALQSAKEGNSLSAEEYDEYVLTHPEELK